MSSSRTRRSSGRSITAPRTLTRTRTITSIRLRTPSCTSLRTCTSTSTSSGTSTSTSTSIRIRNCTYTSTSTSTMALVRIVGCCCCWCVVVVVIVIVVVVIVVVVVAASALRAATPPEPGARGTTDWTPAWCDAPPPNLMTQVPSLKEETGAQRVIQAAASAPPQTGVEDLPHSDRTSLRQGRRHTRAL